MQRPSLIRLPFSCLRVRLRKRDAVSGTILSDDNLRVVFNQVYGSITSRLVDATTVWIFNVALMKVVGLFGLLNVWCLPCVRGNDLRQLIFKDTLANSQASRWQSFGILRNPCLPLSAQRQQGPRAMLSGVQVDDFELRVDIKPEARTQAGVFRVDDSRRCRCISRLLRWFAC